MAINLERAHSQPRNRFLIILLGIVGGFLLLMLLIAGGIWIFRRPIVEAVLTRVNETIPGKFEVQDGYSSWWGSFPYLQIRLEGVTLREGDGEPVIIFMNHLETEANPWALLSRKIDVESLRIDGADCNLTIDNDGRIDLFKALDILSKKDRRERAEREGRNIGFSIRDSDVHGWSFMADEVLLNDLRAIVTTPEGRVSAVLPYLDISLHRDYERVRTDLSFALDDITNKGLGSGYFLRKQYDIELTVVADRRTKLALIEKGTIKVRDAIISLDGSLTVAPPYEADLTISSRGVDLNLLSAFLPSGASMGDVVIDRGGEISLNGSLTGPLADRPDINLIAGCRNLSIRHVPTGALIEGFGFLLEASAGSTPTTITVRELNADFPAGHLRGNMNVVDNQGLSLILDLDGKVELAYISRFVNFPGAETLAGDMSFDIDIDARYDYAGRILERKKEQGTFLVNGLRYTIPDNDLEIHRMDFVIGLKKGILGIDQLDVSSDAGDLSIYGRVEHIWPFILGHDDPLIIEAGVSSHSFNPSYLFSDPEVAAVYDREFTDISLDLEYHTTVSQFRSRAPLPEGVLILKGASATSVETGKSFSGINGRVEIGENLMAHFDGNLKESAITLEVGIEGYRRLLVTGDEGPVSITLSLFSPSILGNDVLPEGLFDELSRLGGRLDDLELEMEGTFENSAWFDSPGSWPSGHWTLKKFKGSPLLVPLPYEFAFDLTTSENEINLNQFTGKVGNSDFRITGWVGNAGALLTTEKHNITGRIKVEGNRFDIGEVMGIELLKPEREESSTEERPDNWRRLAGKPLPDLRIDLAIREILLAPHRFPNVSGGLSVRKRGLILLDELSLEEGRGTITVNGDLDLSQTDHYDFKATLRAKDVDLEMANVNIMIEEEPLRLGDTVKGVVDGLVNVEATIEPDLSVHLEKAFGRFDIEIASGHIVDFPPLEAMANYFDNRNMKDVRFSDLELQATLENGIFHIPRTAVGSSLGYLEIEGRHELNGFMSYSITVPNDELDSFISNLFNRKNRDDEIEDEIITAENTSRRRTTINVVGHPGNVMINLGRSKRSNLEKRWERRHGSSRS